MAKSCQYCGSPLRPGQVNCESCGQPVPQADYVATPAVPQSFQNYAPPQSPPPGYYPPQTPYMPSTPPQASSGGCWRTGFIVLVVLVVLSICCTAAVGVAIAVSGASILNQFNNWIPSLPSSILPQSTLEALIPTNIGSMIETEVPNLTLEPSSLLTAVPNLTLEPSSILTEMPGLPMDPSALLTALPMQQTPEAPTDSGGGSSVLVDETSEIILPDNKQVHIDITQKHEWFIGVKQPSLTIALLPPSQPDSSSSAVTVTLKLTNNAPGQVAGVRCMLQDENNYYQVALKDKSFSISKVLDGKATPLTTPAWKPSNFVGPKGFIGGANIEIVCNPYGIGLSVNGIGEIPLVTDPDSSFSSGRVAIFSGPGSKQVNGFYSAATFGDYKVETSN